MRLVRRAGGRVLEVALEARRGSFRLEIVCRLTASWTVVFGPSGAGKSTLLRLLAGLDRDSVRRGNARVIHEGRVLSDSLSGAWLPPGQRETALVAQQPALFPHLSVRSNVAYGIAHLPRSAREQRVEEMLAVVGGLELMRPASARAFRRRSAARGSGSGAGAGAEAAVAGRAVFGARWNGRRFPSRPAASLGPGARRADDPGDARCDGCIHHRGGGRPAARGSTGGARPCGNGAGAGAQ